MNPAPPILKAALESRAKDPLCAVEFYLYSYVPHSVHGFEPDQAVARFATETTTFTYLATSAGYYRETLALPSLSRIMGKQANSVTINFSNISRRLATFVLNNEVEGMRVVIRILSRANLSNATVSPSQCSFVPFVGKCGPSEGFDRKDGSITSRQDLGQIEAQIPPKEFQVKCPLEFGGAECLGTELLTDKNAAYQTAFATLGRHGCNKTSTQCAEFENLEFNQGIRVVQIQGSFIHRPHEGFFQKLIGLLTPGSGKRRVKVGSSVQDGTPYGKPRPMILGRWQMPGIPLQFHDVGTSVRFRMAFAHGPIADMFNVRTNTPAFSQPQALVKHYGRYGGEADQLESTFLPGPVFFSRLAYAEGYCTGSDIAVEEPAPDISAIIAGTAIDLMDTAHLMNRCGSGRVNGGGMSYNAVLGTRWTDNPVELVRVLLFDDGLLNLDRNFLDARRTAISSQYCNGAIRDESNAERLLLPDTETAKAGVDYKRYNTTGMVGPGSWPISTLPFPASRAAHEATYEFFDPDDPPAPEDIEVLPVYRKRYTANTALPEKKKVIDFAHDTLLPACRGFFSWNWKGQIGIRLERPADSLLMRASSLVGATTLQLDDVMPWKGDVSGPINEEGDSLIGKILIGVSLNTSEVRSVLSAAFTSAGNSITLAASATGGTTATASGPNLTGGSSSVRASGTITIGGSLDEGDTVTATIDGIDSTYTLQDGETAASVAAALGFAINANLTSQRYVEADNGGWNSFVDIKSKMGAVTLSSALEEAHDAGEETIRVMMSFADRALTYADTTRSNILDGSFRYLGTNGQTRYNQFKGTYHDPLRDFAEQSLIVNDEFHQEIAELKQLEIDLSAVDNYHQASRLLNGANVKFGDGLKFFEWGSNGLALQLEEGDVVCVSHPAGEFRNVPVRIEQLRLNERYEVTFSPCRLYSTSMFNDTVEQSDIAIPSGLTNFASAPPDIQFDTVEFPPNGLEQSTDGTAGITSIRGGAIFGDSIYAQYGTAKVVKRGGVTVNEQPVPITPDAPNFEFLASIDGLYTIQIQACNQWGCSATVEASIVIGFGSLFGIAKEGGVLFAKEGGVIVEKEHA